MLLYCFCDRYVLFVVKKDQAHNVSVLSLGIKITKTVLFLFERDNCTIWFCCFPKIQFEFQLKGNPKSDTISFSVSVPEFILRHREQKRDTSYLQHTHYSRDQFLLCLVIHAFKSLKFRREIGSFGMVPIPACVRPGISFRA